jgi:Ca2+-binding EF-hand superfamily protein
LGVSVSSEDLDIVIQQFDADKDDALNFQEFLSLMAALRED